MCFKKKSKLLTNSWEINKSVDNLFQNNSNSFTGQMAGTTSNILVFEDLGKGLENVKFSISFTLFSSFKALIIFGR
jgi:hypothetical protein